MNQNRPYHFAFTRIGTLQRVLYVCALMAIGFWTAHPIVHNHLPEFLVASHDSHDHGSLHDHDHGHDHSHDSDRSSGPSSDSPAHHHSDSHQDCALIGLTALSQLRPIAPADWLLRPIERRLDRLPTLLVPVGQFDPALESPPRGPPAFSLV